MHTSTGCLDASLCCDVMVLASSIHSRLFPLKFDVCCKRPSSGEKPSLLYGSPGGHQETQTPDPLRLTSLQCQKSHQTTAGPASPAPMHFAAAPKLLRTALGSSGVRTDLGGVGGPEFKRFHGCWVDASEAVGGSMFALARQTVSSRCLVLIPAEEFVKPERKNLRIAFIPKQPPQTCLLDLQPPDGYNGEKTLLPNPGDSCAEDTRK